VIGANGLGRNDEREYEKKEGWNSHDRWPYPDLGEYHEVAYWRTTWKEDYLLCRGGSIRLIATGDDGTTGSVQWYSVNIIGAPEGSVHAISRWQQEWHVKLIETAAHYTK